jgi:hypothetical protein
MLENVRGRSLGTTTASWLPATLRRVRSSIRPALASTSICASSALTNTSTGAPSTICRARMLEAPKLKRTAPRPAAP